MINTLIQHTNQPDPQKSVIQPIFGGWIIFCRGIPDRYTEMIQPIQPHLLPFYSDLFLGKIGNVVVRLDHECDSLSKSAAHNNKNHDPTYHQ